MPFTARGSGNYASPRRVVWQPDAEKFFEDMFIRFDSIYEHAGRRTDGHTPHNGIGRAYVCIALQKSQLHLVFHHELC